MISPKNFRIKMEVKKFSIPVPKNAKAAGYIHISHYHPFLQVLADFDQPATETIDLLLLTEEEPAIKAELVIEGKNELIGYGSDDLKFIGYHNGYHILKILK